MVLGIFTWNCGINKYQAIFCHGGSLMLETWTIGVVLLSNCGHILFQLVLVLTRIDLIFLSVAAVFWI